MGGEGVEIFAGEAEAAEVLLHIALIWSFSNSALCMIYLYFYGKYLQSRMRLQSAQALIHVNLPLVIVSYTRMQILSGSGQFDTRTI